MIEINGDSEEILNIRINGESLRSDDGKTWSLPKGLVSPELLTNELPENADFEICNRVENDVILMDTIPIRLRRIGSDRIHLTFEDSGTRKYWDGKIGFKSYMETKRAVVEDRATEVGDVRSDPRPGVTPRGRRRRRREGGRSCPLRGLSPTAGRAQGAVYSRSNVAEPAAFR